jgi:hypothetical protein
MRLSEAITIYLAAGASFGVYNFTREQNPAGRRHSLLKAARGAILWPLAAAKILSSRLRPGGSKSDAAAAEEASALFIAKVGRATHELLASLYGAIELAKFSSGGENENTERASRATREIVEKYVELTILAAEADPHAPPSEREMEFHRVAGCRGADLMLAGRCIHRRNAARLVTHQARARTELLHALAEIRETFGAAMAHMTATAARHLSVAALRFYGHAFNLLSLLEDESAALSVARLLDAECARLRRLETLGQRESKATKEDLCTIRAPRTAFTSPSWTRALD